MPAIQIESESERESKMWTHPTIGYFDCIYDTSNSEV